MALQLQHTDPDTYATGNYWDFTSLVNDVTNNVTNCSLGFYVSSAAFTAGAQPVTVITFSIPGILTAPDCFTYITTNYTQFSTATNI